MKLRFESTYIKWGITAVVVVACSLVLFFLLFRAEDFFQELDRLEDILKPFLYGLIIAYLLCPLYNLIKRSVLKIPPLKGKKYTMKLAKMAATVVSLLAMFATFGILLWMVIPQLISSISLIAKALPEAVPNFIHWMDVKFQNLPILKGPLESGLGNMSQRFVSWVEGNLIPEYDSLISGISGGVFSVLTVVKNLLIGIVISVFFINSKETFAGQSKKLVFALMKEKHAEGFLQGAAFTHKIFGKFINGKLIDSLIVGILCFIVMSLLDWPYPVLISVIIGVTNLIPFFGPFIGAVPSILLILIESPITAVYFIVFILVLQQVDGNIIGPKILGESTGLSSFWVMFAILVGGGLFGFLGMIIGIPIFAVIYSYVCYAVNTRLKKKGLSTNLKDYQDLYVSSERKTHD